MSYALPVCTALDRYTAAWVLSSIRSMMDEGIFGLANRIFGCRLTRKQTIINAVFCSALAYLTTSSSSNAMTLLGRTKKH